MKFVSVEWLFLKQRANTFVNDNLSFLKSEDLTVIDLGVKKGESTSWSLSHDSGIRISLSHVLCGLIRESSHSSHNSDTKSIYFL